MTLVITDVDDRIPTFNRENFTVAVPEDVGKFDSGGKSYAKFSEMKSIWTDR